MKSFSQYITEKYTPKQGTLNVFDIDDTLFKTTARVGIKKNGKLFKRLNSGEFNTYTLKDGESFDFGQFRDAKHFKDSAKPITKMFNKAKAIISNQKENSKSILLTARADMDDREAFLQTFRDHGFPIDQVHVERAGNLARYKADIKPSTSKLVILRRYIKSGLYNKIRVYDDSTKNLEAILSLKNLHPEIDFEAWYVKEDGSVNRFR
jgi:hypothetical protein